MSPVSYFGFQISNIYTLVPGGLMAACGYTTLNLPHQTTTKSKSKMLLLRITTAGEEWGGEKSQPYIR